MTIEVSIGGHFPLSLLLAHFQCCTCSVVCSSFLRNILSPRRVHERSRYSVG